MSDREQIVTFVNGLDEDHTAPCPDLLLLDMYLPNSGDGEIMEHLRSSGRCAADLVALTSSDSPADHRSPEKNAAIHFFRRLSSVGQFMHLDKIVKDILSLPS
jgi:CheY-like chemotaxis protein